MLRCLTKIYCGIGSRAGEGSEKRERSILLNNECRKAMRLMAGWILDGAFRTDFADPREA